jgi:hypothetical protein
VSALPAGSTIAINGIVMVIQNSHQKVCTIGNEVAGTSMGFNQNNNSLMF